jgi:hypothetical protein
MTTDSTTDAPANGSSIVVTAKFGSMLPTTSGSWSGLLTTAGLNSNTFDAGVTTTSTGVGQFRQAAEHPGECHGVFCEEARWSSARLDLFFVRWCSVVVCGHAGGAQHDGYPANPKHDHNTCSVRSCNTR